MILGGSFQAHTDVIGIGLDGVGGDSDAFISSIALPAPEGLWARTRGAVAPSQSCQ